MSSKPVAKRMVHGFLGTCCKDQRCPHAVQAALVANGDAASTVWMVPIVVNEVGGSEACLAHPFCHSAVAAQRGGGVRISA